ncbi:MAG: hypothetical protein OES84_05195 [Kiritimatiellaceae bacterium]|nr:hypothetical protein [Kiritimatiellaceae bacterium]
MLKKLNLEKLEFPKEIHDGTDYPILFGAMKESFALLQSRSQMMLVGLAGYLLSLVFFLMTVD